MTPFHGDFFQKLQVFVSHFEKRRNSRTEANIAELDPGRFETESEPPMMLEREIFCLTVWKANSPDLTGG